MNLRRHQQGVSLGARLRKAVAFSIFRAPPITLSPPRQDTNDPESNPKFLEIKAALAEKLQMYSPQMPRQ